MQFNKIKLQRFRAMKSLSRQELARSMQGDIETMSSEAIRSWEIGRTTPKPLYLKALAKALKRKERDFYDL